MEGFLDMEKTEPSINFIPCVTWVRRGVAKPNPERLQLTAEELAAVIKQTKKNIKEVEEVGDAEVKDEIKEELLDEEEEMKTEVSQAMAVAEQIKEEKIEVKDEFKKEIKYEAMDGVLKEEDGRTDKDIAAEYGLDDYDDEGEVSNHLLGLGDLAEFADPSEDPYLRQTDLDVLAEEQEDLEDFQIRATDNLLVCGHVEGDSSSLEVYVYNDVEDAFYVHHDVLLPSFPLALEWLSFDPESDTRGNLCAVGSMQPTIGVWDLDIVDCLEPAFTLGKKGSKKRGIKRVGHRDAVLALSWNSLCDHVLGSGSVDMTVLLWDLSTAAVASKVGAGEHKEKVQALHFHPLEAHSLLSGCCDGAVRVYDCRAPERASHTWALAGEVERVLWDHFTPHTALAATDAGQLVRLDLRQPDKPLWSLAAHSEAVTGLSLSPQVPGLVSTVSSDKSLKVWDIQGQEPVFVMERELKLGSLHTVAACPDAPFVVCAGGDRKEDDTKFTSNNMKLFDVRESKAVRERFGERRLLNPLATADFGFSTASEAEPGQDMETEAAAALESLEALQLQPPVKPGAAAKAARKKEKKGKKKNKML